MWWLAKQIHYRDPRSFLRGPCYVRAPYWYALCLVITPARLIGAVAVQ